MAKSCFISQISLVLFFLTLTTSIRPTYAGEQSTYKFKWLDPDKEVYVLQNRKFRKDGRVYLNIGAGMTTSGAFVDSKTIQSRAGYFFTEEWGIELLYAKTSGAENATALSLRNEGASGSVPFRRIIDGYNAAMLMWSPFYSKINTFNKIYYYDILLGVGLASLTETNNKKEFLSGGTGEDALISETHTGYLWNIGMKFFLSQSFDLRLDLTTIHYQAETPSNKSKVNSWYTNYDLAASVGYSF